MSFKINDILCDVFAHIDKRSVSDTVRFSISKKIDSFITAFLFCNNEAFPISQSLTAQCCIKSSNSKKTIECSIGATGEIIVPIPEEFHLENENLSCEINISGVDEDNLEFLYKAASFIVAVTK